MGNIYRQAAKVQIWLGKEEDGSGDAINQLTRAFQEGISQTQRSVEITCASWLSLASFFDRPWWSRLWVCQELLLNREAVFVSGLQTIAAFDLMRGMLHLMEVAGTKKAVYLSGRSRTVPLKSFEYVQDHATEYVNRQGFVGGPEIADSVPLLSMVHSLCHTKCTNARDKIFGLLAFARDDLTALNFPDYSLECSQV